MRLYPNTAGSSLRLRFGRRLARGLRRHAATAPLATGIDLVQTGLDQACKAREALDAPIDDAADDLAFAELEAERHLRRCHARCRELDGDRVGAITKVAFPNGLTAETAPKGQAQSTAIDAAGKRIDTSKQKGLVGAKAELAATIDEAKKAFQPAYEAWIAAVKARDEAFSVEKIRRDEHRRTIDGVFGGIREAFPDDAAMREAIVPRLRGRPSAGVEEDDSDEDEGPAVPAAGGSPSAGPGPTG